MPQRLTEQKRAKIEELIQEGWEYQEIAKSLKISEKTVVRIKKELAETVPELTQTISENKYKRKHEKSQKKYLDKIKGEKALFEDIEEGWIFQMTAEEMKKKEGGRWWAFIVYPESAPKDWERKITLLHCEWAHSPLHDKDVWEHDKVDEETGEILYKSGDRKKAHYHCLIKTEKPVSYKQINELIRPLTNGPYLQKCLSLKGAYEYFVHLNHPDRYQYEKDEICRFNNFVIETTRTDRIIICDEIAQMIVEKKWTKQTELTMYYAGQYEYIDVISTKAFYFRELLTDNYRVKNGRNQTIEISEKSIAHFAKKLKEVHKDGTDI